MLFAWGKTAIITIRVTCRSAFKSRTTPRRGGRVVECGGLENRLAGIPGYEGSNPSSSASEIEASYT